MKKVFNVLVSFLLFSVIYVSGMELPLSESLILRDIERAHF